MKQAYADIFIGALYNFGYLWASGRFYRQCLEVSRKQGRLFLFFAFAGWLLSTAVYLQYPAPYIVRAALGHALFIGLAVLLFGAGREKKVLAASFLIAVETLVGNFCNSIFSCLALFFYHTAAKVKQPLLAGWAAGLVDCASSVSVILAVYVMPKYVMPAFSGKPRKWYAVSAIPLLALATIADIADWGASNGIMVKSGGNMGLYYDQIFSHTEICVLAGLSIVAAGFSIFGMDRIFMEQKKSSQYHAQIAVYQMLEAQYRRSERLRHDMKNHVIALSGLFQNKEWEKMGDYLKRMEGGLQAGGDLTGNKVVDALLYQKRKWAEKESIQWECDVQIPKGCGIDAFDLCILFGNILDNALEACGRMHSSGTVGCRFVRIKAKPVKKYFLIEVKNSMDPSDGGKARGQGLYGHGIGLLNVEDVAQKYYGAVNIEAANGTFAVSILMQMPDGVRV